MKSLHIRVYKSGLGLGMVAHTCDLTRQEEAEEMEVGQGYMKVDKTQKTAL